MNKRIALISIICAVATAGIAAIGTISNGESNSTVRGKINAAITAVNTQSNQLAAIEAQTNLIQGAIQNDATWTNVASAATNKAVAIVVHPDGHLSKYSDFQTAVQATTNGCSFELLADVELNDNFMFIGNNMNLRGNGHVIDTTMSAVGTHGTGGGEVYSAGALQGTNNVFSDFRMRSKFVEGANLDYQYCMTDASSRASTNRYENCTFQLENYIIPSFGAAKTFVSVNNNYATVVENCTIVHINTNRTANRGAFIATHGRPSDEVQFINCRFVGTTNTYKFAVNDNSTYDLVDSKCNLSYLCVDGAESMTHEEAMSYLIPGTQYLFGDNESTSTFDGHKGRLFHVGDFYTTGGLATPKHLYQFNGSNTTGYRQWGFEVASNATTAISMNISSTMFGGADRLKARVLYLTIGATTAGGKFTARAYADGADFESGLFSMYSLPAAASLGNGSNMTLEWGDWHVLDYDISQGALTGSPGSDWVGDIVFSSSGYPASEKYIILAIEVRAN